MTEAEWNECACPEKMLEFLRDKANDRKLRLFATAYCRRLWHLLVDQRSRDAVEVAEQFADGLIDQKQLTRARHSASAVGRTLDIGSVVGYAHSEANFVAICASRDDPFSAAEAAMTRGVVAAASYTLPNLDCEEDGWAEASREARDSERRCLCCLFRCVLGPLPFRPVTIEPAWLTPTVTSLAQAIYEERAFDRLPIFADALEDAGCDNPDILCHCRGGGEHVRGCWVVDLVLGKT